MAGVVLFSLRSAGGFLLVQRLRRMATVPASGAVLQICRTVQQSMGITRAVRFCRSAALQVPAVVGGIRPIVLLPVTALTGLTDLQIEAIVAHELAHIQRFDYFVNLFQIFAETALFYHPAVWWVNQQIRAERENCCDDRAIAVCGNRLEYVRALTHLESLRLTPQFAMAANGSPLKARVRRLLGMAEEKEGIRSESSVVLGVLIVVGVVLAGSSFATGARSQSETPAVSVVPPVVAVSPAAPAAAPSVRVKPVIAPRMVIVTKTPIVQLAPLAPAVAVRPMIALSAPFPVMTAVHIKLPAIRAILLQAEASVAPAAPAASSESYVDGMKAAGYGDLTVDELVAMKVQGVTPDYVKQMREAGLKLDVDELIGLKVQGITPEYVRQMRAAAPDLDTDSLIGMKVQGVTPEYVRDMRATGLNFDTDDLIGMKVQGVTPAYVAALKSAGLEKLDADEILGAKAVGITPEFIEKARSHGFKDLDLDKLMELKTAGVL